MSSLISRRHWLKTTTASAALSLSGSRLFAGGSEADATYNLSSNESQFGPSPHALEAFEKAETDLSKYPLEAQQRLIEAIASKEGVSTDQVLLAAGSAQLLMAAAHAFASPGANYVTSNPTFSIVTAYAKEFGVESKDVNWNRLFGIDLSGLESAVDSKTELVYICNPENPAGTVLDAASLGSFCEKVTDACPVLVDEAYLDFTGEADRLSMIPLVKKGLPVIVIRTFSKAYGLAGLRIGYAITTPDLAKKLSKHYMIGIGLGCSCASLDAALAAYQDRAYLDDVIAKTAAARNSLAQFLTAKRQPFIPSRTTFTLFPVFKDSKEIAENLMRDFKIKVSPRNYFGANYLRVSMGRPEQMKRLEEALSSAL